MATRFDDWEGDFLAHHGIKGQKWGVRRFQNPDGTLTAEGKKHYGFGETKHREAARLARQFNRGIRKLNRAEKKADVQLQAKKAQDYKDKAKVAGMITAGLAAATAGSHLKTAHDNRVEANAWKGTHDYHDQKSKEALNKMFEGIKLPGGMDQASYSHLMNLHTRESGLAIDAFHKYIGLRKQSSFGTAALNTRTKVLAGATAAAAGYTAYAAIRSKVANYRTTDKGHAKAVEKYKKQYSKMMDKFANTPYQELLEKQRKKQG